MIIISVLVHCLLLHFSSLMLLDYVVLWMCWDGVTYLFGQYTIENEMQVPVVDCQGCWSYC